VYNPDLGDGRGFLFAQLGAADGRLLDLGTKGSGTTPWSRGGDGRLTLKGGVREVLATEMLEALGVETSKTFSLFETGERLQRGDEPSPTRSSVLVRLSHSHVRIGSFQRHAHHGDLDRMRRLLDYVAEHLIPSLTGAPDLPTAFLAEVARRLARLCATWMAAGFVHGVLNSDNLNVTGESFDYGPYRFLPRYDPAFTAAYFDHGGLYAFGRQPRAVLTGLARLADAIRPLAPSAPFGRILETFEPAFGEAFRAAFLERLGLASAGPDLDDVLADACYAFIEESELPFDRLFFDWYGGAASESRARESPERARYAGPRWTALRKLLDAFAPSHPERLERPYFQRERPETLLIDEIEALWKDIAERDDWEPFEAKIDSIREMGATFELADSSPDACGAPPPGYGHAADATCTSSTFHDPIV
jgi:uncharacterized protein YdiU (UPF0061 family)